MITPITLSSTLSRMDAKYFGSASGNTASHPLWCEYGEVLSDSTGVEAQCHKVRVQIHACLSDQSSFGRAQSEASHVRTICRLISG